MTFSAADATSLTSQTNQAMASKGSQFAVNVAAINDSELTLLTSVVDHVDCSAMCRSDAVITVVEAVPPQWVTEDAEAISSTWDAQNWQVPNTAEPVVFTAPVAFDDVSVGLALAPHGQSTLTISVGLPTAANALIGTGLQHNISQSLPQARITQRPGEAVQLYDVTVTGSLAQIQAALDAVLPGSVVAVTDDSSSLLRSDSSVTVAVLVPLTDLFGGTATSATVQVSGADGYQMVSAQQLPTDAVIDGGVLQFASRAGEPTAVLVMVERVQIAPVIAAAVAFIAIVGLVWFWARRRGSNG